MWYYTLNDQQAGPVSQAEHLQILQSSLPADTLVWKEGIGDWVVASTLGEFQALTNGPPNSPPPLATAAAETTAHTTNPYTTPAALSYKNHQVGDYPLPKMKKANFGLLMALMLLAALPWLEVMGQCL